MESMLILWAAGAAPGQIIYAFMIVSSVWGYQTGRRWMAVASRWAAGAVIAWSLFELVALPALALAKIAAAVCCWLISRRERPSLRRSPRREFSMSNDTLDDFR
jgi:hypothetical protein